MGLDNSVEFYIRSKSLGFAKHYEVCYFRKYWGLREQLNKVIDFDEDLDTTNLLAIKDILDYYSDIHNIRGTELSTIWSEVEECHNIRRQRARLQAALDYVDNNINLEEFLEFLSLWRSSYYEKADADTADILAEILESPPDDLETGFYFVDSY